MDFSGSTQDADLAARSRRTESETMLKEFKEFIMRGNVVDLAVAVVIGAAFGAIVQSLVNDIIMPIVGAITGGLDFTNYFTPLSSKVTATGIAEAKKQGAVLAWGNFLQVTVNFLIIAAVLFLVVKGMNVLKARMATPGEAAKPARPAQEVLLEEIRDLLARSTEPSRLTRREV